VPPKAAGTRPRHAAAWLAGFSHPDAALAERQLSAGQ